MPGLSEAYPPCSVLQITGIPGLIILRYYRTFIIIIIIMGIVGKDTRKTIEGSSGSHLVVRGQSTPSTTVIAPVAQ